MGAQANDTNSANCMHRVRGIKVLEDVQAGETKRVKVYRLNEQGKWNDEGTGHISVDYLERPEDQLSLVIIDEEDDDILFLHCVLSDVIYKRQEDTIISWKDPELSTELALSFQDASGCSYIWDSIYNMQRDLHLNNESFDAVKNKLMDVPPVEMSTLPLILKIVIECGITDRLHVTELISQDQSFFPKLVDLFRMSEDMGNLVTLHTIFKLTKGIILLNSPQMFEKIFSDDLILDIIGFLEYDPDMPHI